MRTASPGRGFRQGPRSFSSGLRLFKRNIFISLNDHQKAPYQTFARGRTLNFSPSPRHRRAAPVSGSDTSSPCWEASSPRWKPQDLHLLTTGGVRSRTERGSSPILIRAFKISALCRNGPFPLEGANLPYDSYTRRPRPTGCSRCGSKSDCNVRNATRQKPLRLPQRSLSFRHQQLHQRGRSLQLPHRQTKLMTMAAATPWRSTTCRRGMCPS